MKNTTNHELVTLDDGVYCNTHSKYITTVDNDDNTVHFNQHSCLEDNMRGLTARPACKINQCRKPREEHTKYCTHHNKN